MMGLPHLFHTAGLLPVISAVILVYLGASLTGMYICTYVCTYVTTIHIIFYNLFQQ